MTRTALILAFLTFLALIAGYSQEDTGATVIRIEASHSADNVTALYNGVTGESSGDYNVPRFTWWDRKGTREWVSYIFDRPAEVSLIELQWFDDTGRGQCRVPASWRLLYRDGGKWKTVQVKGLFEVTGDEIIEVEFEPVTADGLRIEVQLQPEYSGGLLAWHVPGLMFPGNTSPPFMVKEDLFDHSNEDTLGLSVAPGTETITIFAPNDDTDKFSHGTQLMPFKGHLYAMWQSTPRHEDSPDSWVAYSRSPDGKEWEDPMELVAAMPEGEPGFRSGGGWWTNGEVLVSYIQWVSGWGGGGWRYTQYMTSLDGINWSELKMLENDAGEPINGAMEESVAKMPDGRLLVNFQGTSEDNTKLIVIPYYTDDPSGLSGWTPAELPLLPSSGGQARGLEPSWFMRPDGSIVNIFRDQHETFRLLASVSEDRGETWSEKALTNMRDSRSMQAAGNLPDGTAYIINNPVEHSRRLPLTVTLSRDGIHFDRAYLLRGKSDLQPQRYSGRAKGQGYSYPGRLVWNGYLYASYATNKEDVEITRVPLESLIFKEEAKFSE